MTARCIERLMTGRCISGAWLGEAHHCVIPAVPNLIGDLMLCAACEASIAGLGPLCDCPGCTNPTLRPHLDTQETTTMTDTTASTSTGLTVRRPKIEIYPYDVAEGADPEHGFRLRAGNGEIVMHGEGYGRPSAAEARARAIVIDGAYANARVVHLDETGEIVAEAPVSTEADPASPVGPVKVTVSDPETGEVLAEQVITNDYVVITAGNTYIDRVQAHANGTAVITVKRAGRGRGWMRPGFAEDGAAECSEPSGYHDDGDPMVCTLVEGHDGDHAHHDAFTWAPGTLATDGMLTPKSGA